MEETSIELNMLVDQSIGYPVERHSLNLAAWLAKTGVTILIQGPSGRTSSYRDAN